MAKPARVSRQHESPPERHIVRTVADSLAKFHAKTPNSSDFELNLGGGKRHWAHESNNRVEQKARKAYKGRVAEENDIIDDTAVKLNIPKFAWPAFRAMILDFRNAIPLPEKAPELYDPNRREPVVDFLRRVWKDPWIDQGTLTRPDLRRLDPRCDMALRNWQRGGKNQLPADLHISSKAESLTRELENPERVRNAYRLARADYLRKSASPT